MEEESDWATCGSCGNDGASGATASYSMQRGVSNPNMDGSAAEFQIGGSHPYKNGYWYIKRYNTATTPLSYLKYEFYLYIPNGYQNAPQAIEFECQQRAGGYVYNFAWQADYVDHQWRTFNYLTSRWEYSGIAFSALTPGVWHHIVAEYHTQDHQAVHDALTVDDTRRVLNISHAAKAESGDAYLSNAFQLDLNSNPTPYHVYVDEMSVTYK